MIYKFSLFVVFLLINVSAVAMELNNQCSQYLKNFKDDCELQVHYWKLREAFKKCDLNIDFIALYRIPRLIDSRIIDLNQKRDNESYDNIMSKPWEIYEPAPKSWILWETGNYFREVLNFALDNRGNNQASGWTLSLHDLERLHKLYVDPQVQFENGGGKIGNFFSSLFGLTISPMHEAPGIMRHTSFGQVQEFLNCDSGNITLQDEEISAINSFERKTLCGKPYIQWSSSGSNKGRIQYLSGIYVIPEMTRLIAEINTRMRQYLSQDPSITESPLQFVARIQRAYVAIHPFRQGNGRMSRYLQDLILAKLDMPLIPGGYLQRDLSVSLGEYQSSTLSAVKNMLSRLESCLDPKNESLECQSLYLNNNVKHKAMFNPIQEIHNNIRESISESIIPFKEVTDVDFSMKFIESWSNSNENFYLSPGESRFFKYVPPSASTEFFSQRLSTFVFPTQMTKLQLLRSSVKTDGLPDEETIVLHRPLDWMVFPDKNP